MKIGAIVRLNKKGLGYQTRSFARNMPADRILFVRMPDRQFPDDLAQIDEFDCESTVVLAGADRKLDPVEVMPFLKGLDVVFSAETLYDWRLANWARDLGVRTVVQGNPEFYTHHLHPDVPQPDRWVWPTPWMLEDLPPGPVLPCPVEHAPSWLAADPRDDGPLRVVHVAGHKAAGDRNGTDDFVLAIPKIRSDVVITIIGQDGWLPSVAGRVPRNVELVLNPHGVQNHWDLYSDQHLVVLPRRYGGNCLPANEACAAGCALMMPAVSPNEQWPIIGMQWRPGRLHLTPFGRIKTATVRPEVIASTIDAVNRNRNRLVRAQSEAVDWAIRHTWEELRPRYMEALS